MKKLILVSTALIMAAATPAFARMSKDSTDHHAMADAMFKKIDMDNDGMISREEHDAFANKMFTEADTNSDGKLSKEEMSAYKTKEMADMKSGMGMRVKTSQDAKTNSNTTVK